jgi:putative PIN family toxin of toxin-antitoxin system
MVRVVLDTNVVISAALKPSGNKRAAVAAIRAAGAILLLSPALLAEYEQVAARRKFRRVHAELGGVLTQFD